MKTLLRTPIKSLLILLFICGSSILFISQWSSWYLDRESRESAKESYAAIGYFVHLGETVQTGDTTPADGFYMDTITPVLTSPAVAATDFRLLLAGYLPEGYLCVGDYERKELFSQMIFEGTLLSWEEIPSSSQWYDPSEVLLTFRVDTLLAGVNAPVASGGQVTVNAAIRGLDNYPDCLCTGASYFVHTEIPAIERPDQADLVLSSYPLALYPLEDAPSDYLQKSPFILGVREISPNAPKDSIGVVSGLGIETLSYWRNIRTVYAAVTTDMSADPRFWNGDVRLLEGRLIGTDDREKMVCLISEELALQNGLSIGDKLPVSFGVTPNGLAFAVQTKPGWYRNDPATAEEYYFPLDIESGIVEAEIIGIFSVEKRGNLSSDPTDNTVYCSPGCLPLDFFSKQYPNLSGWMDLLQERYSYDRFDAYVDTQLNSSLLTFRLHSADEMLPFIQTMETALPEMKERGHELVMDDMGYSLVRELLDGAGMGLMGPMVSLLALIAGLILAAYLFLLRRRKDYAILRSLGVPAGKAAGSIAAPFLLLGSIAAALAGIGAKLLGTKLLSGPILDIVTEDPSILPGATAAYAELPHWLPITGAGIAFLLLSMVTLIALIRLRTTATLSLLQEKED